MKVTAHVHPICLDPDRYWFDEFNLELDRRNRVSVYLLVVILALALKEM